MTCARTVSSRCGRDPRRRRWLYRRPTGADGSDGSQGAVILLVVAAILPVHALGLARISPEPGEIEMSGAMPVKRLASPLATCRTGAAATAPTRANAMTDRPIA